MMIAEGRISPYLISWVGFQTWAMYFLAGCTPKAGFKAFACYVCGVAASIVIVKGIGMAVPHLGTTMGPALVVGVVAFLVICFEKIKVLDFIPGWFLGAGAYFAMINGAFTGLNMKAIGNKQALLFLTTSCALGLIWGWATVVLRTKYGTMIAPPAAPATAPAAKTELETANK